MNDEFDKDSWCTPSEVLELVRKVFGGRIGFDPCPNIDDIVDPDATPMAKDGSDGLAIDWYGVGPIFCNPPYSRGNLIKWAKKIHEEARSRPGMQIIFLVPNNTETKPWQKYFWDADAVCFPDHRIKFLVDGKPKGTGKSGHAIGYFGPHPDKFAEVFDSFGRIVFPELEVV